MLMYVTYSNYVTHCHPALHIIENYFAAFNEEKGEKSIHLALMHLKDSNFSFDNLRDHYLLQPIFTKLLKNSNMNNYKKSNMGYKNCKLDLVEIPKTPLESRSLKIFERSVDIIEEIKSDVFKTYVFTQKTNVYFKDSESINFTLLDLTSFINALSNRCAPVIKNFTDLKRKLEEELDDTSIPDDLINW